jgi:hypothetical protein
VEDKVRRNEDEIEDDTSCSHYSINELKKKLKELKEKKEEFKK